MHKHTQNGILISHKNYEIVSFEATWMNLEIIKLIELNQTERNKYRMMSLNMWTLKIDTNELSYKTELESDVENKFMAIKGYSKGEERKIRSLLFIYFI